MYWKMIFISHNIFMFIFVWTIWNSAPRYSMSLHGICSMCHKHEPDRIARWKRGISVTRISQKVCIMCFETPYSTEIIKIWVYFRHLISLRIDRGCALVTPGKWCTIYLLCFRSILLFPIYHGVMVWTSCWEYRPITRLLKVTAVRWS